jgi:hypothetical protein
MRITCTEQAYMEDMFLDFSRVLRARWARAVQCNMSTSTNLGPQLLLACAMGYSIQLTTPREQGEVVDPDTMWWWPVVALPCLVTWRLWRTPWQGGHQSHQTVIGNVGARVNLTVFKFLFVFDACRNASSKHLMDRSFVASWSVSDDDDAHRPISSSSSSTSVSSGEPILQHVPYFSAMMHRIRYVWTNYSHF